MLSWIKWKLGIGWVCTTIIVDTFKQAHTWPFRTLIVEKRDYRNVRTGELRQFSKRYWV